MVTLSGASQESAFISSDGAVFPRSSQALWLKR
jgi:hypothetical protein